MTIPPTPPPGAEPSRPHDYHVAVEVEPGSSAEPEAERAPRRARPDRVWLAKLLAERSRRGRTASWVLACVAAAVAAIVVWSFFPHDRGARVDVTLGGDAAAIGPLRELIVWPGMQVQMVGARASAASAIQLLLDRTQIGAAASSSSGAFLIGARIPRGTAAGRHRLTALDTGTGRQIGHRTIEVRSRDAAELWTLPAKPTVGGRLAVAGGGFTPHTTVRIVWDPGTASEAGLASRRIKSLGVLTVAVRVPTTAATGVHRVIVMSRTGRPLVDAASVVVTAAR